MGNDRERHEVAHGGEIEGEEVDLANAKAPDRRGGFSTLCFSL